MANLTFTDKVKLEKALDMDGGYVLNFSNRTFQNFFGDVVGIDIYDSKYDHASGSKANRMRAFWDVESNYTVGKVLQAISESWSEFVNEEWNDKLGRYTKKERPVEFQQIIERIKSDTSVPDLDALKPNADDKDFEVLANAVKEHIQKNEPEIGLDRLHTFLVKYFRALCNKREISYEKRNPLHSLVGQYANKLRKTGVIESEMTERILKSSISVMEAFNKVRNDQSYAHDNKVLNYQEALLIFNNVSSSIKFIESIESSL